MSRNTVKDAKERAETREKALALHALRGASGVAAVVMDGRQPDAPSPAKDKAADKLMADVNPEPCVPRLKPPPLDGRRVRPRSTPRLLRDHLPPQVFEKTLRKILRALARGCTHDMAARLAGVAPRTFSEWKRTGKQAGEDFRAGKKVKPGDQMLIDFDERCARAVTAFGNLHIKNIERGALSDPVRGPEHSKWLLSHHPQLRKSYGDNAHVEHTGANGKPIETSHTLTLADLHLALNTARDNVVEMAPSPPMPSLGEGSQRRT